MRRLSLVDVSRAASVLAVLGLLAVLAVLLPSPGYRSSRLYLFLLIAALGVVGAVGAVRHRPSLAAAGGVGLFLLGFWQAVLGVVVLPVAGVLALTAFLVYDEAKDRGSSR